LINIHFMTNKNFKRIAELLEELPQYADDIKDSLQNTILSKHSYLTLPRILGVALTAGYAIGNESLLRYIRCDAKKFLTDEEAHASKIAVSTLSMMGTYNYFNRQKIHKDLVELPSNLSISNLDNHGIEEDVFSMYCLAAATVNKSLECIEKYTEKLMHAKVPNAAITMIVEISSVFCAISAVLEIKRLRSYEFPIQIREENI
jgi:hypothetical protein